MKRILVAEDEAVIAMALEPVLRSAGFVVVGPMPSLVSALEAVEKEEDISVALLDINLRGQRVDAVADALDKKGIPFMFLTGYGRDGLPKRYRDRPVLTKPYFDGALVSTLNNLLLREET